MKTMMFSATLLSAVVLTAGNPVLHVSPNGNDAAAGCENAPLRSPQRAVEMLRKTGGGTVRLRGGFYSLATPLALVAGDSNIVFEAVSGEVPVLSAGRRIEGWKVDAKGWWHVSLPRDVRFSQLYVNGQRRIRPYLPRKGYYVVEYAGREPVKGLQQFTWRGDDVCPTWPCMTDIEMCVFHSWTMSRLPFETVDATTKTVTLTRPFIGNPNHPFTHGTCYRLDNVRAALGEPGDWYLERSGELIYVPMPGESPDTVDVVAPIHDNVLTADGVVNITFKDIVFAHAGWNVPADGNRCSQASISLPAAVSARGCSGLRLKNCAVLHTGAWGVSFGTGSRNCAVEGCELVDLGAGGVMIGPGKWSVKSDIGVGCSVTDTLIEHGGRVDPAGPGIWVGCAQKCVLSHNTINDMYYSGISCGWQWSLNPNHPTRDITIEWNRITNIGQDVLADMGGIYTLGVQPGTVERFNFIRDLKCSSSGFGIYFDSGSAFISVSNNIVIGSSQANWFQACIAASNVVANNIFAFSDTIQLRLPSRDKHSSPSRFERNVVLWRDSIFGPSDRSFAECSFADNLAWSYEPGEVTPKMRGVTVADPCFRDPEHGDFSIVDDAALRKIGFVPFSLAEAGRRRPPVFTARLPPVPPVFLPVKRPDEGCLDGFEENSLGPVPKYWHIGRTSTNLVCVTDRLAATGKKCLEVTDTHADWTPHFYRNVKRTSGRAKVSFALMVEKGAKPCVEMRSYRYWVAAPGPIFSIDGNGGVHVGGRVLTTVPHDKWVRFEIDFELGSARKSNKWNLRVKVDGEADEKFFAGLSLHPRFRELNWIGFISNSQNGERYYLDDFSVE